MSATPAGPFDGTRYQTLIARLLLSARGGLLHGELADSEGTTLTRFVGRDGLLNAIRGYLASCEEQAGREPPPPGARP